MLFPNDQFQNLVKVDIKRKSSEWQFRKYRFHRFTMNILTVFNNWYYVNDLLSNLFYMNSWLIYCSSVIRANKVTLWWIDAQP